MDQLLNIHLFSSTLECYDYRKKYHVGGTMINGLKQLFIPYKGLPKEIYIIFIARIMNSLGGFVNPLLVLILTQKVGLDTGIAGTYITFISVIAVPGLLLGGKLTDLFNRKWIIFACQGLGAFIYIAVGFVSPSMLMVYMIMAASFFFIMCSPAYDAILADLTSPDNRKGAYSLVYMGWNIGFAVGPAIAGLLFKDYLSLIFIIDGICTLFATTLIVIFIKETKRTVTETDRVLEQNVEGSIFKVLLSRPILIMFALILLCIEFAYTQWSFSIPLHLDELFGDIGASYFGILASFNGILVIIFTPILTRITQKARPIRVISSGALCYAIAFGMLAFTTVLPLFYLSIFIMTVGEILIAINAATFMANMTPASHRGRMSSILPLLIGTGNATSPMIMGNYISAHSIASAWVLIGTLSFLSAALMWILQRSANKYVTVHHDETVAH